MSERRAQAAEINQNEAGAVDSEERQQHEVIPDPVDNYMPLLGSDSESPMANAEVDASLMNIKSDKENAGVGDLDRKASNTDANSVTNKNGV